jgi:Amt family ammonium transporter
VQFVSTSARPFIYKYDDSLDVFGVHGVGGMTGTILCGVFATAALSVSPELPLGNPGVITVILLRIVGALTPLRASQEEERQGLDISLHGEALQ